MACVIHRNAQKEYITACVATKVELGYFQTIPGGSIYNFLVIFHEGWNKGFVDDAYIGCLYVTLFQKTFKKQEKLEQFDVLLDSFLADPCTQFF